MTEITDRFGEAVQWAAELHQGQVRKATGVPYISHLLAVSCIVLEHGGDESEAIAGVLHDAIEDTTATRADIEERFGPVVASIVDACSDSECKPKPPWRERKQAHLDDLRLLGEDRSTLLVVAADKLHNARSVIEDHRHVGDALWGRFNAGPEEQLWYYRSVSEIIAAQLGGAIADDLSTAIDQLTEVVRAQVPDQGGGAPGGVHLRAGCP